MTKVSGKLRDGIYIVLLEYDILRHKADRNIDLWNVGRYGYSGEDKSNYCR